MSEIVVLSERNLWTLLHKLQMPGSARTLIKPNGTIVVAEPDEVHYDERPEGPGPVHPATEQFIRDVRDALQIVKAQRGAGE